MMFVELCLYGWRQRREAADLNAHMYRFTKLAAFFHVQFEVCRWKNYPLHTTRIKVKVMLLYLTECLVTRNFDREFEVHQQEPMTTIYGETNNRGRRQLWTPPLFVYCRPCKLSTKRSYTQSILMEQTCLALVLTKYSYTLVFFYTCTYWQTLIPDQVRTFK